MYRWDAEFSDGKFSVISRTGELLTYVEGI